MNPYNTPQVKEANWTELQRLYEVDNDPVETRMTRKQFDVSWEQSHKNGGISQEEIEAIKQGVK